MATRLKPVREDDKAQFIPVRFIAGMFGFGRSNALMNFDKQTQIQRSEMAFFLLLAGGVVVLALFFESQEMTAVKWFCMVVVVASLVAALYKFYRTYKAFKVVCTRSNLSAFSSSLGVGWQLLRWYGIKGFFNYESRAINGLMRPFSVTAKRFGVDIAISENMVKWAALRERSDSFKRWSDRLIDFLIWRDIAWIGGAAFLAYGYQYSGKATFWVGVVAVAAVATLGAAIKYCARTAMHNYESRQRLNTSVKPAEDEWVCIKPTLEPVA